MSKETLAVVDTVRRLFECVTCADISPPDCVWCVYCQKLVCRECSERVGAVCPACRGTPNWAATAPTSIRELLALLRDDPVTLARGVLLVRSADADARRRASAAVEAEIARAALPPVVTALLPHGAIVRYVLSFVYGEGGAVLDCGGAVGYEMIDATHACFYMRGVTCEHAMLCDTRTGRELTCAKRPRREDGRAAWPEFVWDVRATPVLGVTLVLVK
jgi:hypothetical protein